MCRILLPRSPVLRSCRLLPFLSKIISLLLPSRPPQNVPSNAKCPMFNSTNPTPPPRPSTSSLQKTVPVKSVVLVNLRPLRLNPVASPNVALLPKSPSVVNSSRHTVPRNVSPLYHLPLPSLSNPNPNVHLHPKLLLLIQFHVLHPSKSNLRMLTSTPRMFLRPRRARGGNLLLRKRGKLLQRVARPTILFPRLLVLRFTNVRGRMRKPVVGKVGLEKYVLRITHLLVGLFLMLLVSVTTKESRTSPSPPSQSALPFRFCVSDDTDCSGKCAREDCIGDSHATVTRHCISEFLQKGARGSTIPRSLRLHWCNKCYMR